MDNLLPFTFIWICLLLSCTCATQWKIGQNAQMGCSSEGPRPIRSAIIPYMGIGFSEPGKMLRLNNVVLGDDIGEYLLMSRLECDSAGFLEGEGKLVKKKGTNNNQTTMEAYSKAPIMLPDLDYEGKLVKTAVKVVCDRNYNGRPKMGLSVFIKEFALYVKDDGGVYFEISEADKGYTNVKLLIGL